MKGKIVHLPSVVQSELYEAMRILYSTIYLLRVTVAPFWDPLDANSVFCSVSAAPHGYVFYVYLCFDLNENSVSVWCGWHRTEYAICVTVMRTETILPIRRIRTLRRAPETPGGPLALKDVLILVLFLNFGQRFWKHEWSFLLMQCAVTLST